MTSRITLVGLFALITAPIGLTAHAQSPGRLPQPQDLGRSDGVAAGVLAVQPPVHNAAALREPVMVWVQAWAAQDAERYLGAYAPEFRPPHGRSRKAWKMLRRERISDPGNIQLSISDMEVLRRPENRAEVVFRQDYRSDRYQDSVRKRLDLVRDGERWLIAEERVVATLAAPGAAPVSAPATIRRDDEKKSFSDGTVVQVAQVASSPSGVATTGAAGIPVGPLTAYPGIDLAIGYNDNLLYSPSNEISTPVVVIAPYITLEGRRGPHRFDIRYRGETGLHSNSSNDNYNDNALQANAKLILNARNDLTARLDYRHGHDARGSTDRPLSNDPDRYRQAGAFGLYGYGADGAKGRIEIGGEYFERRYTNNRQITAASDRNDASLGGTFFWRVAPKTRLLFQGRYIDHDYVEPGSDQDSSDRYLYLGARWDVTAKTTGFAKYGYSKKVFRSSLLPSQSGNSWDLGVRWSPRTYSVFDFTTYRRFEESTGVGDAIVQSRLGAKWTHAWNTRLSHSIGYDFTNNDYKGGTTRDDDTNALSLRFDYRFRRWLKFGAEYLYTHRDSNDPQYRYRRNVIMFSIAATL